MLTGQRVEEEAPAGAYDPAGAGEQATLPPAENEPAGQVAQAPLLRPEPAAQEMGVHRVEPAVEEEPEAHGEHTEDPVLEVTVLTGQRVEVEAPEEGTYEPAGAGLHATLPPAENEPAEQVAQAPLVKPEPAVQEMGVHCVEPMVEEEPEEQGVQLALPVLEV